MEMRGRNRKWLGTGDWRAVREVGFVVLFKFRARIEECGSGSGRRSVNRKEGADCGELTADFFFLNIEEASDVLNHLFVGESHLIAGGTVWRRGGDDVGGVVDAVGGGQRVGRNEDGRRGAGHRWNSWAVVWCVEGEE